MISALYYDCRYLNVLVDEPRIGSVERQFHGSQLVEEHPHRPHISREALRLLEDNLRRYVLGSPYKSAAALILPQEIRSPEVSELENSLPRQHDVLWLDVPVYNLTAVQILQRIAQLLNQPNYFLVLQKLLFGEQSLVKLLLSKLIVLTPSTSYNTR